MLKSVFLLLLLLIGNQTWADSSIFKAQVNKPMPQVYQALYQALENERLWVVFEADIGRNLQGMAKRLGDDYNRNQLDGLRVLVVCNAWYANAVSNADPDMLALCPFRITVHHKAGVTTVLFAQPSVHAQQSPALGIIQEIEQKAIAAIKAATQ